MAFPHPALILLGPTGSGKTPLGDALAEHGVGGRCCLHFDFGAELRRAAVWDRSDPSDVSDLSMDDRTFIRRVLEEGALLEPENFPVAERVLKAFLARACPGDPAAVRASRGAPGNHAAAPEQVLLVLNGLPRHIDQAKALC